MRVPLRSGLSARLVEPELEAVLQGAAGAERERVGPEDVRQRLEELRADGRTDSSAVSAA